MPDSGLAVPLPFNVLQDVNCRSFCKQEAHARVQQGRVPPNPTAAAEGCLLVRNLGTNSPRQCRLSLPRHWCGLFAPVPDFARYLEHLGHCTPLCQFRVIGLRAGRAAAEEQNLNIAEVGQHAAVARHLGCMVGRVYGECCSLYVIATKAQWQAGQRPSHTSHLTRSHTRGDGQVEIGRAVEAPPVGQPDISRSPKEARLFQLRTPWPAQPQGCAGMGLVTVSATPSHIGQAASEFITGSRSRSRTMVRNSSGVTARPKASLGEPARCRQPPCPRAARRPQPCQAPVTAAAAEG